MSEKNQKFLLLTLGVLTMSLIIGYFVFAWQEPTQSPPQGNVPAPINVGSDLQYKSGSLGIGGILRVYSNLINTGNSTNPVGGACPSGYNWYDDGDLVLENGECYITSLYTLPTGNVGIGTTKPRARVHIFENSNRQFAIYDWLDASGQSSGYGWIGGNAYLIYDGGNKFKYSNTHGSIGAIGIAFNYPSWNKLSILSSGTTSSTANQEFTPSIIATFDYAGNVGIGTTGPDSKLHVIGGICAESSDTGCTVSAGDVRGTRLCIGNDCRNAWPTGGGGMTYWNIAASGTVGSATVGQNETVTIIGESCISATRSTRDVTLGLSSGCIGSTYISNGGVTSAKISWPLLAPQSAATNPQYSFSGNTNTGIFQPTGVANTIAFSTAGSERVRINSAGNVGIGTTSPGSTLTVRRSSTGTAFAIRNTNDTADTFTISDTGSVYMTGFRLGTSATAGQVLTASSSGVGTWQNLPGWIIPSDVRVTNNSTTGARGGYAGLHNWIQNNGCSGYHVCETHEIIRWYATGHLLSEECWYNSGIRTASGESATDCTGWSSDSFFAWGQFWDVSSHAPSMGRCNYSRKVCCCRY